MARTNSNILKILEGIEGRDMHTKLHDFFVMGAIAIRNKVVASEQERFEKRYMDIASTYNERHLQLFAKAFAELYNEYQKMVNGERAWSDLAGEIYMESATSNDKSGQFFTPYCLSQATAEANIDIEQVKKRLEADKDDVITFYEPSCGAGGMIIAAADTLAKKGINYSWNMHADCTDLDERCVCMAYIQLSLLGIPASIHHGNTLYREQWSTWDTPAYVFNFIHFHPRIHRKRNESPPTETKPSFFFFLNNDKAETS